ncbi:MAG: agmatinase [Candidatus Diapherotrites archaeon]
MKLKEECFNLLGPEFVFSGVNFPEEQVKVIIYGAPLDATTCAKPGARYGPNSIREVSADLGSFVLSRKIDYFEKTKTHDLGNIRVEHGDVQETIERIEKMNKAVTERGKVPFMLGGEHSISFGAVKAFAEEKPLIVVFDSHPDLMEDKRLHHGSWLRKALQFIPKENVIILGILGPAKSDWQFIQKNKIKFFTAREVKSNLEKTKKELGSFTQGKKFYLSLDIDVLEAGLVPGTGCLEPGGLSYFELLKLIESIEGKAVGMDLVETAPDAEQVTQRTAAKLCYELLVQDFL